MSKQQPNFETALNELTTIVELLERGEGKLDLETSLKKFERGIELTRECQKVLADAEQKVKILVDTHKKSELVDFNEETQN